jgi:ATP-dependent exoDNAse (exonuclease V) beta subunit
MGGEFYFGTTGENYFGIDIPLQERIEGVADDADLEDIYNTERQLLYVACTRARDHLIVTGTEPASEFLDDLGT